MANVNILELQAASTPTNGIFYVVIDGVDYQISYETLISLINNDGIKIIKDLNKSANYSRTFNAGNQLQQIDIKKLTGNPIVRIGTSLNGTDILPDIPVVSTSINSIVVDFVATTTLYITISGGSVSLNFKYYENNY
jgi:hypothetical protein